MTQINKTNHYIDAIDNKRFAEAEVWLIQFCFGEKVGLTNSRTAEQSNGKSDI